MTSKKKFSDQDNIPWKYCGGLQYVIAADIKTRAPRPLPKTETAAVILEAVQNQWPTTDPDYHLMVAKRFLCYGTMPPIDAVRAIQRGYSSPSNAFAARVIRRRTMTRTMGSL